MALNYGSVASQIRALLSVQLWLRRDSVFFYSQMYHLTSPDNNWEVEKLGLRFEMKSTLLHSPQNNCHAVKSNPVDLNQVGHANLEIFIRAIEDFFPHII